MQRRRCVYVAYDHNGGQLRNIPLSIEIPQRGTVDAVNVVLIAQRHATPIPSSTDLQTVKIVASAVSSQFLEDNSAFFFHSFRLESDAAEPVFDGQERGIEHTIGGLFHGNGEPIDGAVETGKGVNVSPELHSQTLEVVDHRPSGEVLRTDKGTMLQEMGSSFLPFVLHERPNPHHQSHLDVVFGCCIGQNEIAKPILEPSLHRTYGQRNRCFGAAGTQF